MNPEGKKKKEELGTDPDAAPNPRKKSSLPLCEEKKKIRLAVRGAAVHGGRIHILGEEKKKVVVKKKKKKTVRGPKRKRRLLLTTEGWEERYSCL